MISDEVLNADCHYSAGAECGILYCEIKAEITIIGNNSIIPIELIKFPFLFHNYISYSIIMRN